MKLKKQKQSNFLILNSIHSQIYKNKFTSKKKKLNFYNQFKGIKNKFIFFKIEQICINIKKILKIIFEFNFYNKSMFFSGFDNTFSKLLYKTNSYNVPTNFWVFGLFDNKKFVCNYSMLDKSESLNINILSKIKKKSDLFVILGNNFKTKMLNECFRVKSLSGLEVPIIFLNDSLKQVTQIHYSVLGNFSNYSLIKKLLFLVLYKRIKNNYFKYESK